jgi:hypothetical protein
VALGLVLPYTLFFLFVLLDVLNRAVNPEWKAFADLVNLFK